MRPKDSYHQKLSTLPVEAPDEIDNAMLEEAARINDGTTVSLETLKAELEEYRGKLT